MHMPVRMPRHVLTGLIAWLPEIFRRSIGARLHLIITVILCGFAVIIAVSVYSFYRVEQPRVTLEHLRNQQNVLHNLKVTLLELIVVLDQVLYSGKNELVGTLLALNEKILSKFDRYQTDADKRRLSRDAYLGKEYEPVVLKLRKDVYRLVAAYRRGNVEEAFWIKNGSIKHNIMIIINFIEFSERQRNFDILDLNEEISSLKQYLYLLSLTIVGSVIVVSIFFANLMGRSVARPMAEFSRAISGTMSNLAAGDYGVEVPGLNRGDEIGTMAGAVQVLKDKLIEGKRTENRLNDLRNELAHISRVNTLGEMAAGLAHELNQPLAAITNFANGILRRLRSGEGKPDELHRATELIGEQALRAGDIICKMRGMAKNVPTLKSRVDVNQVIREAVTLLPTGCQMDGVIIKLELTDSLPPALADSVQIQQVILNLALNGLEAMQEQGCCPSPMTIRSARGEGDAVEVTVEDTAARLRADNLERMFDPFFTTKADGLGMGLTISRSIVEAHNGRLWATSEADTRSTFHFTLPISALDRNDNA